MVAIGLQQYLVHRISGLMKRLRVGCLVVAWLSFLRNLYGQGFVDLNFESATLVPVPGAIYNDVQFARALPGWTESIVGTIDTNALYNEVFLDSAGISIIDRNFPYSTWLGGVIQGNYSAILASGVGSSGPADATLSQTGMVPVGTESLQFKAEEIFDSSGAFTVTLGDQTLPLTVLGTGTNYTLYGANVSQWAGQTADLAFTVLADNPHRNDEYLVLDAIQFSPEPIPEPSVIGLFSISALFLCWRMKWLNHSPEPSPIDAASPHSRFTSRIRRGSGHGR